MADKIDNLYNKWNQTQSKKDFQGLYAEMKPVIERSTWKAAMGSNIPQSAHRIYAAQNFLTALGTYKPDKGTLKTHIQNAVENKAKRLNYLYQDLGTKSESRATKVGRYQAEYANLMNELGREPSTAELADRTNMGIKDIARLQKELHQNLSTNIGLDSQIAAEGSVSDEILSYLYYELNNEQRVVYEYLYGRNGKPRLVKKNNIIDFDAISSKTNMHSSKVRRVVKSIEKKLEEKL